MGTVQSEGSVSTKKPTLIFDATPLIYLCKANLSNHLRELGVRYRLCTTSEVYQEVYVKGLEDEVNETEELKVLFEGVVEVLPEHRKRKKISDLLKSAGLHAGEIAVLEAAVSLDGTAIVDDKRARTVGESMGLNLAGTVTIIIEFARQGMISKSEARDGIDRMIANGWYCSAKDYARMIKAIESAGD